jgi:hypothetical protein
MRQQRTEPRLSALLVALFLPLLAAFLQGCGTRRSCNIEDIYGLIQVDGRTGLSRSQIERAGVKLCARHLRKEETYLNDACVEPERVFMDGELPTPSNGDSNALLLVRCPSTAYPKGKELQRVTCSDDFMGELDDGTIEKALHLRFDNYERAANCLLGINETLEIDSNANTSETVLTREKVSRIVRGNGKKDSTVMRSQAGGSHIHFPRGSDHGSQLLAAAAAVAAATREERAQTLAREFGPAILAQTEEDVERAIAQTGFGILPGGNFQRTHKHKRAHGASGVHTEALLRSDSR